MLFSNLFNLHNIILKVGILHLMLFMFFSCLRYCICICMFVCVLSMFWEGLKQVFLNVFPLCFALNFEGIVWVVLALLTLR